MPNLLPKSDLAAKVAAAAGVTGSQSMAMLDALGPIIRTSTADGLTVALPGLGRFATRTRAARTGRNPATGAPLDIPEKAVLAFKPSK